MPQFLAELPDWLEIEEELRKTNADAATVAFFRKAYWDDFSNTEEVKAAKASPVTAVEVEARRARFFQEPVTPAEPGLNLMEKAAELISPPGRPATPVIAPPPEALPLVAAHQPPLPGPMNIAQAVVAPMTGRTLGQMEGRPTLVPSHAPVPRETTIGPTTGPMPPMLPPVERRAPAPQMLGEQLDALIKGFGVGYEKGAADYQNELRDLTVGLAHRAGAIKEEPPRAETPDTSGVPAGLAGSTGMTLGALPASLLSILQTAGIGRADKAGRVAAKLIPRIVRSAADFAARFGTKTAVETIGAGGTPGEAAKHGGISAAGAAIFGAAGPAAAETAATAGRTIAVKLIESGVPVETAAKIASAVERVVHGTIAATPIYPMAKAQGATDEEAITSTLAWILLGAHKSGAGEWAAKRTDAVKRGTEVFDRAGFPPGEARRAAEKIVDLAHSGEMRGAEAALRAMSREAAKTLQEIPERPGITPDIEVAARPEEGPAPKAPPRPPQQPPAAKAAAKPVPQPEIRPEPHDTLPRLDFEKGDVPGDFTGIQRPPGERWEGNPGAMPGEAYYALDVPEDGGIDDGRAFITEREIPGKGSVWEAWLSDGRGGQFTGVEDAAKWAEEQIDAGTVRSDQGQRVPEAAQEGPQPQGRAQEGQGDRGADLEQAPPREPEPMVEGSKGSVQEVVKQPWEMTEEEYRRSRLPNLPRFLSTEKLGNIADAVEHWFEPLPSSPGEIGLHRGTRRDAYDTIINNLPLKGLPDRYADVVTGLTEAGRLEDLFIPYLQRHIDDWGRANPLSGPLTSKHGLELYKQLADDIRREPHLLLEALRDKLSLADKSERMMNALGDFSGLAEQELDLIASNRLRYLTDHPGVTGDEIVGGLASKTLVPALNPHRAAVERALAEGKPVPPEVLADYPDLKPAEVAPAVEKVGTPAQMPTISPAATEQPPEHVVRALQKPSRVVSDSVITKTKEQAKETIREAIADGTVTRDTPVRLTDTRELSDLVARGGLTEEKSAQIVVGEKGEALPIMGYGHGISAAVIMPEGYSRKAVGLEHAQPNEVKIDPKVPVEEMRFIVDGYKRLLTYAELVELIETGKLAALEQAAALRGEQAKITVETVRGAIKSVPAGATGTAGAVEGAGRVAGPLHPAVGEPGVQGTVPGVGAEGVIAPGVAPPTRTQEVVTPQPAQSYTIEPASHAKNAIIVRIQGGTEGFKGPLHDIVETFKGRFVNRERGYILPKSKEAKLREAMDAALAPQAIPEIVAEAPAPKKSQLANKFRRLADSMDATIEDKRHPSTQNVTARRARKEDSRFRDADRLESIQKLLRTFADRAEAGNLPEALQGLNIASRADLEVLHDAATHDRARSGAYYHKSLLRDIEKETRDLRGVGEARKILGRLQARVGHEDYGAESFDEGEIAAVHQLVNAAKKAGKRLYFQPPDGERLVKMGVRTPDQWQQVKGAVKDLLSPKVETQADRVRKLERELIGINFPGFFPTPRPVVDRMVEEADIKPGQTVLEPSAGKGDIADVLREKGANVETVEAVERLVAILEAKGYPVVAGDFLEQKDKTYDRIVMNPPFEGGQDIDHVQHAYSLLNPGGRVVAIMSEGPFFRKDRKATAFREWLDGAGGTSEKLPEKSFTGAGAFRQTGIAARLVVIDKPQKDELVVSYGGTKIGTVPGASALESDAVTAAIAAYQRKAPVDVSDVRARRDKLEIRQEELNRPLETLKKDYEARRRYSKTRDAAEKRYRVAVAAADEEAQSIGLELGRLRKQSYDASLENALLADPQRELNVEDAELSRLGAAMNLLPKEAADAARRLATEKLRAVAERESEGKSTPEEIERAAEDGVGSLESLPLMSADQHRGAVINRLVGARRERIKEATKDDPDLEAEGRGYGGMKWKTNLRAAATMKDLDAVEQEIADARPRGAAIRVTDEAKQKAAELVDQKRAENMRRPLPEGVREFSYKLTKHEREVLDGVDLGEDKPAIGGRTLGAGVFHKAAERLRSRGLVAPGLIILTPRGEDVARAIQQERMGLPYDQRPGINWTPPDPAAIAKGYEGIGDLAGNRKAAGGFFADKQGNPWITDGTFLVRAKPGTKVSEGPGPEIGPIVNVTRADLDPISGPVAWYRGQTRDNVILSNGLIVDADLLAAVLGKEGGDLYHRKTDTGQPLSKNGGIYVLRGNQVHGVIMPIRIDGRQDLPENYRWMWGDGKIHERDLTKALKMEAAPGTWEPPAPVPGFESAISTKKEWFFRRTNVTQGTDRQQMKRVSGYRVKVAGGEGFRFFLSGDGRSWQVIEETSGKSVGGGGSRQEALDDAIATVARAIEKDNLVKVIQENAPPADITYLDENGNKIERPTTEAAVPDLEPTEGGGVQEEGPEELHASSHPFAALLQSLFGARERPDSVAVESKFPEVERRWRAAKGLPSASLIMKVRKAVVELRLAWQGSIPGINPHESPTMAVAQDILRQYNAVPSLAKAVAHDILWNVTRDLGPKREDLLTRVLALRDIVRNVESGIDTEDSTLSFGYENADEAREDLAKYEAVLALPENAPIHAALERAITQRQAIVQKLVDLELLPEEALNNAGAYYHRQVLSHYQPEKVKFVGTGSGDVRLHKKGFQRRRVGGEHDFNTRYTEAEFEWLSQAVAQIATKETLDKLNRALNIADRLRQEARMHNNVEVYGGIDNYQRVQDLRSIPRDEISDEQIAELRELDVLAPFRQRIAIAMSQLRGMIEDGQVEVPERYSKVADQLADAGEADGLWPFLSWLAEQNDNPGSGPARGVFKAISDREAFTRQRLGSNYLTWGYQGQRIDQRLVPEGYAFWQPEKGNHFFGALTIPEKVLARVLEGTSSISVEDLKRVLVIGGVKRQWVIPASLAKALDSYRDHDESPVERAAVAAESSWKQWTLLNPARALRYNLNNQSGDMDIAIAIDPGIVTHEYLKAARDLWGYQVTHRVSATLREEMQEAIKRGVIESGLTVAEIQDINKVGAFRLLTSRNPNLVQGAIERYWGGVKTFTTWRENGLRLGAYRRALKRLRAGDRLYWASPRDEMDALYDAVAKGTRTLEDVAAKLAREAIGDYGDVSVAGQYLRSHLAPFWSWQEINAPRYVRLLKNLAHERTAEGEKPGRGAAERVAAVAGKRGAMWLAGRWFRLAILSNLLFAMVYLWNRTMFPEDDKLLNRNRDKLSLILGHRADGSIQYVRFEGALSDALDWLNLGNWPHEAENLAAGRKTWKDIAADAIKGPAERIVSAWEPFSKTVFELALGRRVGMKTFESGTSFQPRGTPIRDRAQHVARVFSVAQLYDLVTGKPRRQGVAANVVDAFFTYGTDPGEAAYYLIRDQAGRWNDAHGKESAGGGDPTSRQNALYYYKKALQWGDEKAAKKWLAEYKERGGTGPGMMSSIRLSAPMGTINKSQRLAFLASLGPEDKETLRVANEWYERWAAGRPQ